MFHCIALLLMREKALRDHLPAMANTKEEGCAQAIREIVGGYW